MKRLSTPPSAHPPLLGVVLPSQPPHTPFCLPCSLTPCLHVHTPAPLNCNSALQTTLPRGRQPQPILVAWTRIESLQRQPASTIKAVLIFSKAVEPPRPSQDPFLKFSPPSWVKPKPARSYISYPPAPTHPSPLGIQLVPCYIKEDHRGPSSAQSFRKISTLEYTSNTYRINLSSSTQEPQDHEAQPSTGSVRRTCIPSHHDEVILEIALPRAITYRRR